MKKITTLILILLSTTIFAQDISGTWNGLLKVQGIELKLVFNITKEGDTYTAKMDSPDQGVKDIPVTTTSFDGSTIKLSVKNAGIEYEGTLDENNIFNGNFKQAGQLFPLQLSKEAFKKNNRPQEPVKPYPYHSEDIIFKNIKANIDLAGTLTLPKKDGKFPVAILISGSGPQNRDEEVLGHKPFLIISDYLTRKGIAVLRYDDRGVAKSKGNYASATSLDFSNDVEAAIGYLKSRKEIKQNQIGLIGHSEGGIIAPMVASRSKDVDFIVLLAGTGIPGYELVLSQVEAIGKASGTKDADLKKIIEIDKKTYQMAMQFDDIEKLKNELDNYFRKEAFKDNDLLSQLEDGMTEDQYINSQINMLSSPWFRYFLKLNPAKYLEQVKCPVLAVNGSNDTQVPSKINLNAIEQAVSKNGNKDITIKEFKGLNHLFQKSETGLLAEYAEIEQTFSPDALAYISNWILKEGIRD